LHRIISEKDLVDTDAANDRTATQKPTPRVEELMEALKRSVEEAKAERQGGASRSRRKIS
jgi:non-homologous end joining protein Ku